MPKPSPELRRTCGRWQVLRWPSSVRQSAPQPAAPIRRGPAATPLPPVSARSGRCRGRQRRQPSLARRGWDAWQFSMYRSNRSSSKRTALPVRTTSWKCLVRSGGYFCGEEVFGCCGQQSCQRLCQSDGPWLHWRTGWFHRYPAARWTPGWRPSAFATCVRCSCSFSSACFRSVMSSIMPMVLIGLPASSCINETVS